MITSKELLERTGISRATLNNYISLGILERPRVLPSSRADTEAPRIGFFPEQAVTVIDDMNIHIASATEEQATVAETINKNIHEINAVADNVQDAVQGTVAISEDLAEQSINMRRLVQRFRA